MRIEILTLIAGKKKEIEILVKLVTFIQNTYLYLVKIESVSIYYI